MLLLLLCYQFVVQSEFVRRKVEVRSAEGGDSFVGGGGRSEGGEGGGRGGRRTEDDSRRVFDPKSNQ